MKKNSLGQSRAKFLALKCLFFLTDMHFFKFFFLTKDLGPVKMNFHHWGQTREDIEMTFLRKVNNGSSTVQLKLIHKTKNSIFTLHLHARVKTKVEYLTPASLS